MQRIIYILDVQKTLRRTLPHMSSSLALTTLSQTVLVPCILSDTRHRRQVRLGSAISQRELSQRKISETHDCDPCPVVQPNLSAEKVLPVFTLTVESSTRGKYSSRHEPPRYARCLLCCPISQAHAALRTFTRQHCT